MVRFTIEVDVPENRQVTIQLPPEVPIGQCVLEVNASRPGETHYFEVVIDPELVKNRLPRIASPYRAGPA